MQHIVKLIDGREVASDSEEWRHECEARMVCGRPTIDQRRGYLDKVEKARGKPARQALEATIREIWNATRLQKFEQPTAA